MNNLRASIVHETNEDAVVFPQLDFAFLGTVRRCGDDEVVAYDLDKVLTYINSLGFAEIAHTFFEEEFNSQENGPLFISKMSLDNFCTQYPDTQIWVGLDEAFVGVGFKGGSPATAVFSYEKCVTIKVKEYLESDSFNDDDDDMDLRMTAIEDLEFNTLGAYIGPDTPFHLENELEEDVEEITD